MLCCNAFKMLCKVLSVCFQDDFKLFLRCFKFLFKVPSDLTTKGGGGTLWASCGFPASLLQNT